MLVSCVLFVPHFEENDDAFLAMISEGAYGNRDYHLIYTNGLLGRIYVALSGICGCVRWHSVLQYAFLFIGFTLFTYIFCKRYNGKVLAVFFDLALFYELYVSIQYSKTAAFVSAAGFVALFHSMKCKKNTGKWSGVLVFGGILCCFYGMLLRDSAFYLVGLFAAITFVFEEIPHLHGGMKAFKHELKEIMIFVPVVVLLILTTLFNAKMYSEKSWNEFIDYNDARMELLDYRYDLLDYNARGEELAAKGISENDALLYLTWQFGDDSVLTADFMKELVKAGGRRAIDMRLFKAFVSDMYEDLFTLTPLVFAVVFMSVVVILIEIGKKQYYIKNVCYEVILLAGALAICAYYEYSGRWSHRIVFALLITLLAFLTSRILEVFGENAGNIYDFTLIAGIAVIVFCNVGLLLGNRFTYEKDKRELPDYKAIFNEMQCSKDTIYIADTFTFQEAYKYDVFEPFKEGQLDNFVAVGSWYVNSPVTDGILGKFSYENPFDALASGSDCVTLVDNCYVKEKMLFVKEHKGKDLEPKLIKNAYGFDLYKF